MNSGWGGVISLLIVEIPLKWVTVLTTPPPPPFRASWLVWSRFWPWNQVDTYVYSLLLVRTWKNKGGQLRKALSVVIYLGNIFIALSLVYVPSEIIVWTPPPPPHPRWGLSPSVLAYSSFVFRGSSRKGPSWYRFIVLSLTPLLPSAWCCRLTFLTWSTKESAIVKFFLRLSIFWTSLSKSFHL